MTSAIVLRTPSDERLSALAAAGSERAFEVIVNRNRPDLLAYCSRLLRSDSRGEDVVQQALLNAWIALRGGAGVRELKPWLYRITYNQAISALRRPGHDFDQLSEIADGSAHEFDRRTEVRETLAAVAALPDLQRRAIVQTSVRGESYEAAAVNLGVSEQALRGLVYRARQRVRAAVAAVAPFPFGLWAAHSRRRIGLWQRLGDLLPAAACTGGAAIGIKSAAVLTSSVLIVGTGLVDRAARHAYVDRAVARPSARASTASARRLCFTAVSGSARQPPDLCRSRTGRRYPIDKVRPSTNVGPRAAERIGQVRRPVRLHVAWALPPRPRGC
jgi:RNA polymerase sigma factor (sigma-70 family)